MDLSEEFDIEDDEPSIASVLHAVRDRFSFFCKIIEDILQPETSPATLQECRVFTESDKKELYRLYSDIMILDRKILHADVTRNREAAADVLEEVWKSLPGIKERVGNVVKKMLESWTLDHGDENYAEYFG